LTGDLAPDARQLPRDAEMGDELRKSFGATVHTGHSMAALPTRRRARASATALGSKARLIDRPA
jgi:hypothetical protein